MYLSFEQQNCFAFDVHKFSFPFRILPCSQTLHFSFLYLHEKKKSRRSSKPIQKTCPFERASVMSVFHQNVNSRLTRTHTHTLVCKSKFVFSITRRRSGKQSRLKWWRRKNWWTSGERELQIRKQGLPNETTPVATRTLLFVPPHPLRGS